MGKKRIVKKSDSETSQGMKSRSLSRVPKRKMSSGILCIQATYNNTKLLFTDDKGNAIFSSSAGSLGFKGAKKGTPFAAAKVGELIGEKAILIGVKEVNVVVKGVGAGRESALRGFSSQGISLVTIQDQTPVPHNGPRPRKARRV